MSVNDQSLDRFLDGDASDDEVAEIQAWLQTQEHLDQFVRRAELHGDLRRSLQRRRIQGDAQERCDVPDERRAPASSEVRRTVAFPRRAVAVGAIALVTAACLLFVFVKPGRDGGAAAWSSQPATVVRKVDALLTKDNLRWENDRLRAGAYRLERGLLHLSFDGGVMVYVEAPAAFDAVSGSRLVLRSGRLSASVPREGVGFTVETPEAEVIDFGTEFSVEVESGASEVHVFDGLVRVQPRPKAGGESGEAVDLRTAQAVKVEESAKKPVDIELARDRFIRNFDEPKRKYARSVKQLLPLAYYRMPIRDRGLAAEPFEHSGVVLTGTGIRPPHARGMFNGGSLRVGADSTGRGGRVDAPPSLSTGQFTLAVFVYLKQRSNLGTVATNIHGDSGNFALMLDQNGFVKAMIRDVGGVLRSASGKERVSLGTWRHLVMTVDGEELCIYEDGKLVASTDCGSMASSLDETVWFGTDARTGGLWNGRIDELALFDKPLDADEIADLYQTGLEERARSN